MPLIHCFGEVASCLDTAFELFQGGSLAIWDSALARSQTAGRGQMRRNWSSPAGNMFAALRLPLSPPFDSTAASVAVAALFAKALGGIVPGVLIKWPNDLILMAPEGSGKTGGILLEERGGCLLAGIGINIFHSPDKEAMRRDSAFSATCIMRGMGDRFAPDAFTLWQSLVKHVYSNYKKEKLFFGKDWKKQAEELLLWRGLQVELAEGGSVARGVLLGIAESGGLLLQTRHGIEEKFSGSLRLV